MPGQHSVFLFKYGMVELLAPYKPVYFAATTILESVISVLVFNVFDKSQPDHHINTEHTSKYLSKFIMEEELTDDFFLCN